MFSTQGMKAVTASGGFNWAMARMAPSTAAPPHISYFILSMSAEGLIEMPPVSKVTPLPTRPRWADEAAACGRYRTTMRAGGAALPCATPSRAPMPSRSSSARSSTSHSRPCCWAISRAAAAMASGVSRLAGSLARARVKFCDSASTWPRDTAASNSAAPSGHTTANEANAFLSLPVLWRSGS